MSVLNNLNINPQTLGLLSTGLSLLEGQPFGQSIQTGITNFAALDKLDEDQKRRALLAQLIGGGVNQSTMTPANTTITPTIQTPSGLEEFVKLPEIKSNAPAMTGAPTGQSMSPVGNLTQEQLKIASILPTDQALGYFLKEGFKTYSGKPVQVQFQGRVFNFAEDDPQLLRYLNAGAVQLKDGIDPKETQFFEFEQDLRKEYDNASKEFDKAYDSFQKVAASATSKNPTGADDISLIFNFMKTVDPGSVVREGEFATAENSAGVPQRVRNLYNAVTEGLRLTPEQRTNFLKASSNQVRPLLNRQSLIENQYINISNQNQLNSENVVRSRLPKLGSYLNPIEAASEDEADKLPKGTYVIIGGKIARIF
jgi:hypothetical protein